MSYIPNCRTDKSYNQDKLNDIDKKVILGYDWAIDEVVDSFFFNLDLLEDDEIERWLNRPYPDSYEWEATNPFNDNTEHREVKTYGDYLHYMLMKWAENHRDELIVSKLDGYSD